MRPTRPPPRPHPGCRRTRSSIDGDPSFSIHLSLCSTDFHQLHRSYEEIRLLHAHRHSRRCLLPAYRSRGPMQISQGKDTECTAAPGPQYRSDLGWISGVAFLGTLTRSARPVQGFTCVRCCSMPPASSPHGLAAPGLGRLTTAIPACSCLQLAVATNSLRRGLPPPIQCPCLAHQNELF